MNLLFRLILVVLRARRRPPLGPLDESVIHARVLPTDLDLDLQPQQLVDASPWRLDSPPIPEGVRRWVEAEAAIRSDAPRREHEPIG